MTDFVSSLTYFLDASLESSFLTSVSFLVTGFTTGLVAVSFLTSSFLTASFVTVFGSSFLGSAFSSSLESSVAFTTLDSSDLGISFSSTTGLASVDLSASFRVASVEPSSNFASEESTVDSLGSGKLELALTGTEKTDIVNASDSAILVAFFIPLPPLFTCLI